MAAVYLHNQVYAQNSSETRDILEHSRTFSTISSATLFTNTTLHSQPTEPLLQTTPRAAVHTDSYFAPIARESRNPDGTPGRIRWVDPLALEGDPTSEKSRWQGGRRRPARWRRRVKLILDIVIAVWAIYHTVRYFLAFTIYGSNAAEGQSFSFALGTSAGVAFALSLCAHVLFIIKHKQRVTAQVFRHLGNACSVLNYLSSLFVLAPAIVNLVLIFVWRDTPNSLYNVRDRCHSVDIDIVWSVSRNPCNSRSLPWSIWLTLSCIRLTLTLLVLIIYNVIYVVQFGGPRRPPHHRLRSESYPSTPLPQEGVPSAAGIMLPATPTRNRSLGPQHQISDSTLTESSRPPSRLGRARSQSSFLSNETTTPTKSMGLGRPPQLDSDEGHQDHFQSLVNQISQETDYAMEFASSDHAPSIETSQDRGGPSPAPSHPPGLAASYSTQDMHYEGDDDDYDDDDTNDRFHGNHDNIFNLPPVPPTLGYNEFGLPYPPDEDMRILNGFIRRMPTIESMGSGEITTSITSSHRPGGSTYTSSRPPTRNTLLSFTSSIEQDMSGSAPPSRTNSLSARAEILVGRTASSANGASEHGELLVRPDITTRRVSSPTTYLESPTVGGAGDTYSSNGSHGTTSTYHTATTGSRSDSYPPLSTQPKS